MLGTLRMLHRCRGGLAADLCLRINSQHPLHSSTCTAVSMSMSFCRGSCYADHKQSLPTCQIIRVTRAARRDADRRCSRRHATSSLGRSSEMQAERCMLTDGVAKCRRQRGRQAHKQQTGVPSRPGRRSEMERKRRKTETTRDAKKPAI